METSCKCGHATYEHSYLGCMHEMEDGKKYKFCRCLVPNWTLEEIDRLRAELAALKRPPAVLDQEERKDLEQRLYDAQMLEGSEMEY